MGLVEYQATMPFLRDIPHDIWLWMYLHFRNNNSWKFLQHEAKHPLSGQLVQYGKGRWYSPSITDKITPAGHSSLASQAGCVLGQTTCLQPHCSCLLLVPTGPSPISDSPVKTKSHPFPAPPPLPPGSSSIYDRQVKQSAASSTPCTSSSHWPILYFRSPGKKTSHLLHPRISSSSHMPILHL
jgi:hypothetical protein